MSRLLSTALLAALALGNAFAAGAGVADQYRVNLRVFFRAFWCVRSFAAADSATPPGSNELRRVYALLLCSSPCDHGSPACQWFVGDPLLELVRSEACVSLS